MISHIFYNTDIPKYLRKTGIFKACLERGLKHFAKQNIEVNVISNKRVEGDVWKSREEVDLQ